MADRIHLPVARVFSAYRSGPGPSIERSVWVVLVAVSNCLSAALGGAKFGLATPKDDRAQAARREDITG